MNKRDLKNIIREEINTILETKSIQKIVDDIAHIVDTYDKPEAEKSGAKWTSKLRRTKIINRLKEKRNTIKNTKRKAEYQRAIDDIESKIK